MSTVQLNEPVVKGVYDRLTNNLTALITEINAGVTDGITIEAPKIVKTYIPTDRELTAFPAIGIQDMGWRAEDDTGWELTGVTSLAVVVFLVDLTQERLSWKLRRYSQAIVRCVAAGRRLDTAEQAWGCRIMGVDPGKTLGRREDPETRMSWIACRFEFKDDETW